MNKERFEAGLKVRKKVLGEAHVERSLANATEFTRPLQELVTEYCWGEIWTRDLFDHKTRSIINLAMLTALNRPHEIELHVRSCPVRWCSRKAAISVFPVGSGCSSST
ncbi:carboxymuconolactone decarboxylase family protein [Ensifer sp. ENS05]|uniref:carboxymuconolactone decarboxylase family protein n=1 Tax=Ensifer sp. ENS05 TaxID=2769277 RepID=UPI001782AB21|nr:carboxymuconolactone decarboxylase family protein [Ensifer sp. ENS05]MBD9598175.1 carboxymuconolactone decarboxylase family protein [Ensifer sp. ENS05]